MNDVWIIDDDRSIRWVLEKALGREGIHHASFSSASDALAELERTPQPPAVLLSGDHARIAAWRRGAAETITRQRRPDLWAARGATVQG